MKRGAKTQNNLSNHYIYFLVRDLFSQDNKSQSNEFFSYEGYFLVLVCKFHLQETHFLVQVIYVSLIAETLLSVNNYSQERHFFVLTILGDALPHFNSSISLLRDVFPSLSCQFYSQEMYILGRAFNFTFIIAFFSNNIYNQHFC